MEDFAHDLFRDLEADLAVDYFHPAEAGGQHVFRLSLADFFIGMGQSQKLIGQHPPAKLGSQHRPRRHRQAEFFK
jgi:hypothetical protein